MEQIRISQENPEFFGLITSRDDGNMKENPIRQKVLGTLGISRLVYGQQVHGDRLAIIDKNTSLSEETVFPQSDGFITREPGIALGVYSADCVPIFLFDPLKVVLGLVHSGWKGTELKIGPQAVRKMGEIFGSRAEDLLVEMGPHIRSCCYTRNLAEKNKINLVQEGVKEKNIFISELCTSCRNELFFSYRKEGKRAGRMLALGVIKITPEFT